MDCKSPIAFLLSFFFLVSYVTSFNITRILNQYSDLSTFNGYLTQTGLVDEINRRQTITVLAVDNSGITGLSSQPSNLIKNIVASHVILDYFDLSKLQKLSNKTAILTTLFQATGLAVGQQGFLNVTVLSDNDIAFGSAVPGSQLSAKFVKSVMSQPYNISVLQISSPIIPPLSNSNSPPPSEKNISLTSPPPTAAKNDSLNSPSPASTPNKSPVAPAPKSSSNTTSPAATPGTEAPTLSNDSSPEASPPSPITSDSPSPSPDSSSDEPSAPSPASNSSSWSPSPIGLGAPMALFMGTISSWLIL